MNKLAKIVVASAVVGLGAAGNADAVPYSYGVAFNDVFNWSITDSQGNPVQVVGPIFTSEAHAELNGVTITSGGIGTDAPINNLGTAGNPNNSFIKIDRNGYYSSGDAVIRDPAHATNMGEVYVADFGTGGAGGLNSLSGTLVLQAQTFVNFSFTASPYLEVQTTGSKLLTDFARADLNFSITLRDAFGNTVFDWNPDGQSGNAPLANDILDSADLNHDLFANPIISGPLWYGCPGQGLLGPGPMIGGVLSCGFNAMTLAALPAGAYNLSVTMEEHAHAAIPEPASIFLLGGGLLGLVYGRRKLTRGV